jgi:hypothetical protein
MHRPYDDIPFSLYHELCEDAEYEAHRKGVPIYTDEDQSNHRMYIVISGSGMLLASLQLKPHRMEPSQHMYSGVTTKSRGERDWKPNLRVRSGEVLWGIRSEQVLAVCGDILFNSCLLKCHAQKHCFPRQEHQAQVHCIGG